MRYPPDHKKRAREGLLRASERALKTSGFSGIGVDGLAQAAGVTSGAFYSHFANKEAVLEAVIDAALGEPFVSETESVARAQGQARLDDLVSGYLTVDHSLSPAEGCVMPALSADVARAQPCVKDVYERKMTALVDRIAELLDGDEIDSQRRAWSTVTLMVGAILISRALPESAASRVAVVESAAITAASLVDNYWREDNAGPSD